MTKSGSNDVHGSWFSFFRDKKLNANDYFSKHNNQPKPDFNRKQFGGSIGGPVVKDKFFGFFAYEKLSEHAYFTNPLEPNHGRLFLLEQPHLDAITYSPVPVSFANVGFGTNGNVPQQSFQKKWQFKDAVDWRRGNHGLKFGVDWIYQPLLGGFFKFTPVPGIGFFDNPSVILSDKTKYPQAFNTPGIIQSISATNGDPNFTLVGNHHQFAWYVQDDWRVGRKLTLNLGVRYDVDINLVGGATQNLNRTYLVLKKIDNPITNPWLNGLPNDDKNNFAPRVGWAYDLTGGGKTSPRATRRSWDSASSSENHGAAGG